MAHVKAGGTTKQGAKVAGKRRGVKRFGNEQVVPGNIIVRQKGTKMHPGKGVKMGRDFTIYATQVGVVRFRRMTGNKRGRFWVDVVSERQLQKSVATKSAKSTKPAKSVQRVKRVKKPVKSKRVSKRKNKKKVIKKQKQSSKPKKSAKGKKAKAS